MGARTAAPWPFPSLSRRLGSHLLGHPLLPVLRSTESLAIAVCLTYCCLRCWGLPLLARFVAAAAAAAVGSSHLVSAVWIVAGCPPFAAAAPAAAADGGGGAVNDGAGGDFADEGESADESDSDDDDDSGDSGGLAALYIPAAPIPTPVVPHEVPHEEYPAFVGVDLSPEHSAYIKARKAFYRNLQKRHSKATSKAVGNNRLEATKLASLLWVPEVLLQSIQPAELGLLFCDRWQVERYVRSWAAQKGVQGGVKIYKTWEVFKTSCRTCSSFHMIFNYQPASGDWILRQLGDHDEGCLGAPTPVDGATVAESSRACKSAYTAKQVARAVLNSPSADLDITLAAIRSVCSGIYSRMPSLRFIRSVKREIRKSMAVDRAIEMAAIEGYAAALRECGHKVTQRFDNCCLLFLPCYRHSPLA